MTSDNDPLAGVPAVKMTREQLDLLAHTVRHSDEPENDWLVVLARHIQWERQQRLKAEASLATAQRVNQIAVSESTAVADAVLAGVADAAVQKLVELKSQLKQVEADAAAMRQAFGLLLQRFWETADLAAVMEIKELVPPWVERMQAAISGSAGAALLRELEDYRAAAETLARFANNQTARVDELKARVERLRAAFCEAAGVQELGPGWDVLGYGLEPGDLEG